MLGDGCWTVNFTLLSNFLMETNSTIINKIIRCKKLNKNVRIMNDNLHFLQRQPTQQQNLWRKQLCSKHERQPRFSVGKSVLTIVELSTSQ